MGFLSKLKNKVTGGWAEVALVVPPTAARGTTLTVGANVQVKAEPIEIKGVVVELTCTRSRAAYDEKPFDGITPPPNTKWMHREEVRLADAQVLPAGSLHQYTATFEVPSSAPASGETPNESYSWTVRAAVQMAGNNPDGAQSIQIT